MAEELEKRVRHVEQTIAQLVGPQGNNGVIRDLRGDIEELKTDMRELSVAIRKLMRWFHEMDKRLSVRLAIIMGGISAGTTLTALGIVRWVIQ